MRRWLKLKRRQRLRLHLKMVRKIWLFAKSYLLKLALYDRVMATRAKCRAAANFIKWNIRRCLFRQVCYYAPTLSLSLSLCLSLSLSLSLSLHLSLSSLSLFFYLLFHSLTNLIYPFPPFTHVRVKKLFVRFIVQRSLLEFEKLKILSIVLIQRNFRRKQYEYNTAVRLAGRLQLKKRREREEAQRIFALRDKSVRILVAFFRCLTKWSKIFKIVRYHHRRLKAILKMQKKVRVFLNVCRYFPASVSTSLSAAASVSTSFFTVLSVY